MWCLPFDRPLPLLVEGSLADFLSSLLCKTFVLWATRFTVYENSTFLGKLWRFKVCGITAYQNSIKNDAIVLNHKTQSFLTICPEHLRLPDVGFHNSKTHRRMSLEVTFTFFFICINLYYLNVFFFLNTITFNLYKMLRICRHQSSFYFMLVEDL